VDPNKFIGDTFYTIFKNSLLLVCKQGIEDLVSLLLKTYEEKLVSVMEGATSYFNPVLYKDLFEERLKNYEFIEDGGSYIVINSPDEDTFDMTGELQIIDLVINGLPGEYVEVPRESLSKMTKTFTTEQLKGVLFYDAEASLVFYSDTIKKYELRNNIRFNTYPFSNMPPIDLFGPGEEFVSTNKGKWVREATTIAKNKFGNITKGLGI